MKPGILRRIMSRLGYVPAAARRGFDAGNINRLNLDWAIRILSADSEIYRSLRALRARSRELWMNNPYCKKYGLELKKNVIGPSGIRLQMKVTDPVYNKNSKTTVDMPDKPVNAMIEAAWENWTRKDSASANGCQSFTNLQQMAIETMARDGEILFQKIRGFDNHHGFALHPIEADHLLETDNRLMPNGNVVRMGVELNQWGQPVAYHLLKNHPGDMINPTSGMGSNQFNRVPADRIIHLFIKDRPSQTRGVPFAHAGMSMLNMLAGYQEAEVVAARVAASKNTFFTSEHGEAYKGDVEEPDGSRFKDLQPGEYETLPPGVKPFLISPEHPTAQFAPFIKSMLRSFASATGISYNRLASDLESVNFSSLRSGELDERAFWKMMQVYVIEHFCENVFSEWLSMQLLMGTLKLPNRKGELVPMGMDKFEKFNSPKWVPQGFPWVDPLKEANADAVSLANHTTTHTQILGAKGLDFEDTIAQIAHERDLARQYGIDLSLPEEVKSGAAAVAESPPPQESKDEPATVATGD